MSHAVSDDDSDDSVNNDHWQGVNDRVNVHVR